MAAVHAGKPPPCAAAGSIAVGHEYGASCAFTRRTKSRENGFIHIHEADETTSGRNVCLSFIASPSVPPVPIPFGTREVARGCASFQSLSRCSQRRERIIVAITSSSTSRWVSFPGFRIFLYDLTPHFLAERGQLARYPATIQPNPPTDQHQWSSPA